MPVFELLKFFVNRFSTGQSDFKVYFFFFHFILFVFLGLLDRKNKGNLKRTLYSFFACLYLLFFIQLAKHFYVLKNIGGSFGDFLSYTFKGISTYSVFHHQHELKGTLSYFFLKLFPRLNLDMGQGLVGTFSPVWDYFVLVLFVLLNVLFLRLCLFEKIKHSKFLLIIFCTLHSLVRLSLDGGMFDLTSIFLQFVLIIVIAYILKDKKILTIVFFPFIACFLTSTIHTSIVFTFSFLVRVIFLCVTFTFLFYIYSLFLSGYYKRMTALILFLFLYPLVLESVSKSTVSNYVRQRLDYFSRKAVFFKNNEILIVSNSQLDLSDHLQLISERNIKDLYISRVKLLKKFFFKDLIKSLGVDRKSVKISLNHSSCKNTTVSGGFYTKEKFNLYEFNFVKIKKRKPFFYHFNLELNECLPRKLDIVSREIYSKGIERFVIINPSHSY